MSIRAAIYERIGDRIDACATDGINAEGVFSETVQLEQKAFIRGMMAARLAAMRVIDEALEEKRRNK